MIFGHLRTDENLHEITTKLGNKKHTKIVFNHKSNFQNSKQISLTSND
jgi:hypothetical protein